MNLFFLFLNPIITAKVKKSNKIFDFLTLLITKEPLSAAVPVFSQDPAGIPPSAAN